MFIQEFCDYAFPRYFFYIMSFSFKKILEITAFYDKFSNIDAYAFI